MSDVAISLVNTSSCELLLACLESLQRAGSIGGRAADARPDDRAPAAPWDVEAEIVVLDNASEDGSVEAVQQRFPDVRVIAQRHRAGFGANHNAVIRATSSRYVYVLNEDTTSDDWGLGRMVAHLDANPRVAALGPRLVYPDGSLQDSAWRFPSPAVAALGLLTLGRAGVKQSGGRAIRDVDWVMGAAILLRREALDEVGVFDEEFFIYSEETDLCRRLRRSGWRVRYFPEVTVVHHESQFSAGIPERRVNEMWRSRHRYWAKHHSAAGARAAALLTGGQYALRAGLAAGLRRGDPALAARMRLHARDSWRVDGPGLRELAEDRNGREER